MLKKLSVLSVVFLVLLLAVSCDDNSVKQPTSFTVTLDANGGSADGYTKVTVGSTELSSFEALTRTDWTLIGYYTSTTDGDLVIDEEGKLVANVEGYTDEEGKWVTSTDVTLFAQWSGDCGTVRILTRLNEKENPFFRYAVMLHPTTGSDIYCYTNSYKKFVPVGTYEVYVQENGTSETNLVSVSNITVNKGKLIEDVVDYCVVSFTTDTGIDSIVVNDVPTAFDFYVVGTELNLSAVEKTGYKFTSWFINNFFVSTASDFSFPVYESVNVKAKSVAKTYTITLDANGGAKNGSVKATFNEALPSFKALTNDDKVLRGYYTSTTNGTKVIDVDGKLLTNTDGFTDENGKWITDTDVTLYAQWAEAMGSVSIVSTIDGVAGGSYAYKLYATSGSDLEGFTNTTKTDVPIGTYQLYVQKNGTSSTDLTSVTSITVAKDTTSTNTVCYFTVSLTTDTGIDSVTVEDIATSSNVYLSGTDAKVSATAKNGFGFTSWTDSSNATVSTSSDYTFAVTTTTSLTANSKKAFTVTVSATNGTVDATSFTNVPSGTNLTVSGTSLIFNGNTITATANTGCEFDAWYVGSTSYTNTIAINSEETEVLAKFNLKTVTVTFDANGGTSSTNSSATVTYGATSLTNYVAMTSSDLPLTGFYTSTTDGDLVVTAQGKLVSGTDYTDADGKWATDTDVTLYAHWGALFSVSAGNQVKFTKGNVQYQASTNTWKFADKQTDYIGNAAGNTTTATNRSTQADWIDLFGWGATSGSDYSPAPWECNAVYQSASDIYKTQATASTTEKLTVASGTDWGYCFGGSTSPYRTLSSDEWKYLLNERTTTTNLKRLWDNIGTSYFIIYPDNYVVPETPPSFEQLEELEAGGCIILPQAQYRDGVVCKSQNIFPYWTSTADGMWPQRAMYVFCQSKQVSCNNEARYIGFAVRLVKD